MKRARFPRFPSLLLLLMALLFWLSSNAQAQSGGGYDLSWSTIDAAAPPSAAVVPTPWAAQSARQMPKQCSQAAVIRYPAASGAVA
jgi:hypothetical protein